jgi:hypothetical protein
VLALRLEGVRFAPADATQEAGRAAAESIGGCCGCRRRFLVSLDVSLADGGGGKSARVGWKGEDGGTAHSGTRTRSLRSFIVMSEGVDSRGKCKFEVPIRMQ